MAASYLRQPLNPYLAMNIPPQFTDGIGNITLIDGIVRLDLVDLRTGADNKPAPTHSATLAMPLPGFLRAVDQMNQVVSRLVEQGVLTRNAPPRADAAAPAPAIGS